MSARVIAGASMVTTLLWLAASCGEPFETAGSGGQGGGAASSSGSAGPSTSSSSSGATCSGTGDPCVDCLVMSCPDLACACTETSPCGVLAACYASGANPSDPSWIQYCNGKTPNGISSIALISDCAANFCQGTCEGKPLEPCEQCLFKACPGAMNACLGDTKCADALVCFQSCDLADDACAQGCATQAGSDLGKLGSVVMCARNSCQSACM